jgi:SAM-dependent methyltransferase
VHKDRGHRFFHHRPPPPPQYPAVNPRQVDGRTLTRLIELAEPKKEDVVLDLASGPSYLAMALAPLVGNVFTTDVTNFGTDEGRRLIRDKGIANIHVFSAEGEALPFREGTFNVVTSRIAAHHFSDVRRAMHEIARMVAKGGRVLIADTVVPADEEVDRFINHLDHLHDPTHVRNYSVREWKVLFADAGLKLKLLEDDVCEDDRGECLREWLGRTGASPQTIRQATGLLVSAKSKIKESLSVRAERGELYFQIRRLVLVGEK